MRHTAISQEKQGRQQEKVSTTIPRDMFAIVQELEQSGDAKRSTVLRAALKIGLPALMRQERREAKSVDSRRAANVRRANRRT